MSEVWQQISCKEVGIPKTTSDVRIKPPYVSYVPGMKPLKNGYNFICWHRGDIRRYYEAGGKKENMVIHFLSFDEGVISPLWGKTSFVARVQKMKDLGVELVVSPDFSCWAEFPLAVQIYNLYKSSVVSNDLQESGFKMIPNITFGHPHLLNIHRSIFEDNRGTVLFDMNHTVSKTDIERSIFNRQYQVMSKISPDKIIYGPARAVSFASNPSQWCASRVYALSKVISARNKNSKKALKGGE